ncbi:hypothetical protein LCGC14_2783340, partial [marine sediment metagenome]
MSDDRDIVSNLITKVDASENKKAIAAVKKVEDSFKDANKAAKDFGKVAGTLAKG